MDIASDHSSGKKNSWQDLIENVINSVESGLVKFRSKGRLDCNDIVTKMLQFCEDRKPGKYLNRIVAKILNHVHSVLEIHFQHVQTDAENLKCLSEPIAQAYYKALRLILTPKTYTRSLRARPL